jgi:transcriptional regulator with XRE-family HTH domain
MATDAHAKRLQGELKARRLALGLTQAEVAKLLGVTQQMAAKLERPGYVPSLDMFDRLATALGLELTVRLRARQQGKGK